MTMTLIETQTLATATSAIEFTSIPQDGTDLLLVFSCRANQAATYVDTGVRINGDTGINYLRRLLYGLGSGSGATASDTQPYIGWAYSTGTASTSNTFGSSQIYLPNYTSSASKSVSIDAVSENNATEAIQALTSARWTGTAAITTLRIFVPTGENLLTGSMASLYKITKGSDGIVTTS